MNAAAWVFSALLPFSWAYQLAAVAATRKWARSGPPAIDGPLLPSVSILKPVSGADPHQYENFCSFGPLDYQEYQLLFGALDPNDPALETARRVQREFPECDVDIIAGGEELGLNRKVSNLCQMLPEAKGEIIVLCDSDMRVNPDYLRRLMAHFQDRQIGLVTCPYRGAVVDGPASSLEALGIGSDFIPSAFVGHFLLGKSFAFGSTIALRREALEQIDGFAWLADELADDYRLAEAVSQAGWRVVLSNYVVDDTLGRETYREMWRRRLRWAKTARAMSPGPYLGAFVTYTVPLSLLFAASAGFRAVGWATLALSVVLRCAVARFVATRTGDEEVLRRVWAVPFSDFVGAALWVGSLSNRPIEWRGRSFRIGRKGVLIDEAPGD